MVYSVLADSVLALHFLFAVFVVLGLLLIITGGLLRWQWVRNPWLRWGHLAAIGIVILQSWLGMVCPVTTLEMWLRRQAGDTTYEGSFIAHWLEQLLYYDFSPWVFIVAYTVFGALVMAGWYWVRPNRF